MAQSYDGLIEIQEAQRRKDRQGILAASIKAFKQALPDMDDPERVRDRCYHYSELWLSVVRSNLREVRFDARLIFGFQTADFMGQQVITNGHVAVLVDDEVYDWTAHQFNPDAPVPTIMPLAEWRAKWPLGPVGEGV